METSTLSPLEVIARRSRFYQPLGWIALAGLIATELLRRTMAQPLGITGGPLFYWFADHVFLNGKLLALCVFALAPARPNLNPRILLAAGTLLLMMGSFLRFSHPFYLVAAALPIGAALKLIDPSERLAIILAMAGLGLGIPLNGFTGLLAAKANFNPALVEQLFGSTFVVGGVAMAAAYTGIFILARIFLRR